MNIISNRVTIYRLTPEDVEQFLAAKYGGKIASVTVSRLARLTQEQESNAGEQNIK